MMGTSGGGLCAMASLMEPCQEVASNLTDFSRIIMPISCNLVANDIPNNHNGNFKNFHLISKLTSYK